MSVSVTEFKMPEIGGVKNSTTTEANNLADVHKLDCEPTSTGIIFAVLLIIIATVGLLANAVVIYFMVKKNLQTTLNTYVGQLAIGDILFLCILPFEIHAMIVGQWTYGEPWCKLTQSIRMLNYYAPILFLTVMSTDLAINPSTVAVSTKFFSGLVWGIGFLAVIPAFIHAKVDGCGCMLSFGKGPQRNDDSWTYIRILLGNKTDYYDYSYSEDEGITNSLDARGGCSLIGQHEFNNWFICNFVFGFVTPLVVIGACYAKIIKKVYAQKTGGTESQKSNNKRKKTTRMVASLVLVFVVCWLPYHSFMLSRVGGNQLSLSRCILVQTLMLVFAYLSSALNPFLYTFLGTNRERWKCCCSTESGNHMFGGKLRCKSPEGVLTELNGTQNDTNVTEHTDVPTNNIVCQDETKLI